MRRTSVAVICLSLLLSANAWAELRAYDVDGRYRNEMYEALQRILIEDPETARPPGSLYGRVQLLPTGQILVDAAAATHVQIAAVLEAADNSQVGASPRATLRYWVVLGSRGDDAGTETPSLLNDVLSEVERVHGDLTFQVVGQATLVTESGQDGEIEGRPLTVYQKTYVKGGTLSAEINIQYFGPREGELQVNATMEPGEFLVLGENTIQSERLDGTLFYIVHWPE